MTESPLSLSIDTLFDAFSHGADIVVLCATNRLTRNLRISFDRRMTTTGAATWPSPRIETVQTWMDVLGEGMALRGDIPAKEVPERILSSNQEVLVWARAINTNHNRAPESLALFDARGLAKAAMDAQALVDTWNLGFPDSTHSEETRRFIEWRARFNDICRENQWSGATAYHARILRWLERGAGKPPVQAVFAGFDHLSPFLLRLRRTLAMRGTRVADLDISTARTRTEQVMVCHDAEAECRGAATWTKTKLAERPNAAIGIVVTDLETRRATLIPRLEQALTPAASASAGDAASPVINVSLGLPLARHGMIRTALALLRFSDPAETATPVEFGALLRLPYWSADQTEADRRALLDARLREKPGQGMDIAAFPRMTESLGMMDANSPLRRHLRRLSGARARHVRPGKPGAWSRTFRDLLDTLDWPGERALSSTEFQTRAAFHALLDDFAALDPFLGTIDMARARAELEHLCEETIFQARTPGQPRVQVLGPLEAVGAEFDALWVMGMNDQLWPPPPHPNPLLPVETQRRLGTPGASAETQLDFARDIQRRLRECAPEIVFSHARQEDDRELRPSPLIADLPTVAAPAEAEPPDAIAGKRDVRESINDRMAPPLADGEEIHGGSGLLKAQAICPAWAFYRYRLGAKKLETPTAGLDASRRGTLTHATLEAFWKDTGDSPTLRALDATALRARIAVAAEHALEAFETTQEEKLPPAFRALESRRLQRVCGAWLALEAAGRPPFRVVACEQRHAVLLGRLRINLVVDRIDALLDDDRRIVLDYKTGAALDTRNWFDDRRIVEPQLPLYAAIVLARTEKAPVAAVAFAKVRMNECRFQGIAASAGLLPGVEGIAEPDTAPEAWNALLGSWQTRLEALAEEIGRGEAAVRCADTRLLAHCDVLPLLRLAERAQQFEQLGAPTP